MSAAPVYVLDDDDDDKKNSVSASTTATNEALLSASNRMMFQELDEDGIFLPTTASTREMEEEEEEEEAYDDEDLVKVQRERATETSYSTEQQHDRPSVLSKTYRRELTTVFPEITVPGRVGSAHIGCGGYNYPHWRKNVFYPSTVKQDDELKYYGGRFSCVEINNTFHGIPRETTFKKWAVETPKNFVFTVKIPQEMTHKMRLKDIAGIWQFFYERVSSSLGAKTGPFLFQLPPSLKRDHARLKELIALIPQACRVALEFRSHDWFCDAVVSILREHDIAIVENFTPDNSLPSYDWVTATWTYTRLHGAKEEIHKVNFGDDVLDPMAARIAARRARGLDQYVFFLNDVDAVATKNAQSLVDKVLALIGDASVTSLAPGWKPERDVKKGGPGSLHSMFKKAAEKRDQQQQQQQPSSSSHQPQPQLPSQPPSKQDDFAAKRPKLETAPLTPPKHAAMSSASPKKGSIASFFGKKP